MKTFGKAHIGPWAKILQKRQIPNFQIAPFRSVKLTTIYLKSKIRGRELLNVCFDFGKFVYTIGQQD